MGQIEISFLENANGVHAGPGTELGIPLGRPKIIVGDPDCDDVE